MNKLIGYIELELSTGVVPIKIGCYTLEKFCESYGIELKEIGSVLEQMQITTPDGEVRMTEVPKDPIKFLSTILWHGANYASKLSGGKEYILENAYEWVDEIGLSTPVAIKVMATFYGAIFNGGTPPKQLPEDDKKKEEVSL